MRMIPVQTKHSLKEKKIRLVFNVTGEHIVVSLLLQNNLLGSFFGPRNLFFVLVSHTLHVIMFIQLPARYYLHKAYYRFISRHLCLETGAMVDGEETYWWMEVLRIIQLTIIFIFYYVVHNNRIPVTTGFHLQPIGPPRPVSAPPLDRYPQSAARPGK